MECQKLQEGNMPTSAYDSDATLSGFAGHFRIAPEVTMAFVGFGPVPSSSCHPP